MQLTLPLLAVVTALGLSATTADARGENRAILPSFEELDTNQSGSITLEDMQAHFAGRVAARQDQVIARLMENADADGKLDAEGLRRGLEALRNEQRAALGERRRGHEHGQRANAPEQGEMGARMFQRIDANNDGVIDAAEYEAFTTRMAERTEQRGRGWWR